MPRFTRSCQCDNCKAFRAEEADWKRVALETREVLDRLATLSGELCGSVEAILQANREHRFLTPDGVEFVRGKVDAVVAFVESMWVEAPKGDKHA